MSADEPPPERDPNAELREQRAGGAGGEAPGPPDNPNVQMRRDLDRPRRRRGGFLGLFRRYVLRRTD